MSQSSHGPDAWWWRRDDSSDGDEPEFPTRGDAESWIGEAWSELAEQGVTAVTLFQGEREVYGPMGLSA